MLARRPGRERELQDALAVVDTVSRLLVVGIDVREPADAAPDDGLEVRAVLVEEFVVALLVRDVRDSVRAVRLYARRSD